MRGRFYRLIRDLHLYLGLFISPFVLVFSISVFFLVHPGIPRFGSKTEQKRVVPALALPGDISKLSGRPLIDYKMSERDRAQLAKGLAACATIFFAAGAREVTIPAIPPVRLTRLADLAALDLGFVRPHAVPLTAVHPMGSMRMGLSALFDHWAGQRMLICRHARA